MQMEKQMPTRMRKELVARYETTPRLDMPPMERRVKLPQGMEARPAFFVPHFAVDANHHTNNVWYIRFALEYLPEGFRLRRLRVEYAKSARYRDQIHPLVRQEDGCSGWPSPTGTAKASSTWNSANQRQSKK